MPILKQPIDTNRIKLTCDSFEATLTMNPSDAMAFLTVHHLPKSVDRRREVFSELKDYLYVPQPMADDPVNLKGKNGRVGAKTFLKLPPEYYSEAVEVGFNAAAPHKNSARTISKEKLVSAMKDIFLKKEVSKAKGNFKLLANKKDYVGRYQELFDFKRTHGASFVTPQKIKSGLYSAVAEQRKIENEAVKHYALVNDANQIVATLMVTIHDDTAYVADLIVSEHYRKDKLAQTIAYLAFDDISKQYSNINNVWFIAGSPEDPEEQSLENHLYKNIFPAVALDEEEQKQKGIFVKFGPPGEVILVAANRDVATGDSLDKSIDNKVLIPAAASQISSAPTPYVTENGVKVTAPPALTELDRLNNDLVSYVKTPSP